VSSVCPCPEKSSLLLGRKYGNNDPRSPVLQSTGNRRGRFKEGFLEEVPSFKKMCRGQPDVNSLCRSHRNGKES
jgi:hypothetical protein